MNNTTIYYFFINQDMQVEASITDRPDCVFIATRDCSTAVLMDYLEMLQSAVDACFEMESMKSAEASMAAVTALINTNNIDKKMN